jgi:hypothetical protein
LFEAGVGRCKSHSKKEKAFRSSGRRALTLIKSASGEANRTIHRRNHDLEHGPFEASYAHQSYHLSTVLRNCARQGLQPQHGLAQHIGRGDFDARSATELDVLASPQCVDRKVQAGAVIVAGRIPRIDTRYVRPVCGLVTLKSEKTSSSPTFIQLNRCSRPNSRRKAICHCSSVMFPGFQVRGVRGLALDFRRGDFREDFGEEGGRA